MRWNVCFRMMLALVAGGWWSCSRHGSEEPVDHEAVAGENLFPIRWTSAIEVESLAGIDDALDAPFIELTMSKGEATRSVSTGREWLAARQAGYYARTTYDMSMESHYIFRFEPMVCLRERARPAHTSHLREFTFTKDSVRELPMTLHPVFDLELRTAIQHGRVFPLLPENWEQRLLSGERMQIAPLLPPFLEFFSDATAEIEDTYAAVLTEGTRESFGKRIHLHIVAWADFTGNGIEDILLTQGAIYLGGSGRQYGLRLLTRQDPDGPLIEVCLDADPMPTAEK